MNRGVVLFVCLVLANVTLCVLALASYRYIGELQERVVTIEKAMAEPRMAGQTITRGGVTTWRYVNESVDDWAIRHDEAERKFYKP